MTEYFKLFPNVIMTKGFNRSLLVDLYYSKIRLVPNSLVDFVEKIENEIIPIKHIKENKSSNEIEYLDFLIKEEFGIETDLATFKGLIPLNQEYYPHYEIETSIIELSKQSKWNLHLFLEQIQYFGVKFLEVRFLDNCLVDYLEGIKSSLEESTIESILIYTPFFEGLEELVNSDSFYFNRFYKLIVYNTKNNGFECIHKNVNLIFTNQESIEHEHCGNVSQEYFKISTETYIASKNHNNCLAYKLSIDQFGEIKNCPSHNKKYGQFSIENLKTVIETASFKEDWFVTKNQILICSDCEFRDICKDCRVFTKNGEAKSKPSKCNYNPYISLYSDDPNYLTEEECGITIGSNSIQIDLEKLKSINKKIWSE